MSRFANDQPVECYIPSQGLFTSLRCPDIESCQRNPCPFSHKPANELPKRQSLVDALVPSPKPKSRPPPVEQTPAASTSSITSSQSRPVNLLKRPTASTSSSSPAPSGVSEPLRKIQKVVPITNVRGRQPRWSLSALTNTFLLSLARPKYKRILHCRKLPSPIVKSFYPPCMISFEPFMPLCSFWILVSLLGMRFLKSRKYMTRQHELPIEM